MSYIYNRFYQPHLRVTAHPSRRVYKSVNRVIIDSGNSMLPSLSQCSLFVNWDLKTIQIETRNVFFQENAIQNVHCISCPILSDLNMSTIVMWSYECVKTLQHGGELNACNNRPHHTYVRFLQLIKLRDDQMARQTVQWAEYVNK